MWNAYDEYIAVHEGIDGIEPVIHHIYTPHFSISIDVTMGMYILDMNTIIYQTSAETEAKGVSTRDLLATLWDKLSIDFDKISKLNDWADNLDHLKDDCIRDFFKEFKHELLKLVKMTQNEETLSTGAFEVRIINKGETATMELRMETNYGCDARENNLFPYSYSY